MKFRLVIRSFDGTDRKGEQQLDSQYINGAIDGVDVASDHLGTDDLYQSQHIILRESAERVSSGHNYHMIESLANSCDSISRRDYDEVITDKNGRNRRCKQFYVKDADDRTVTVKSYIDSLLIDDTSCQLQYVHTDYEDTDPQQQYIDNLPSDFEELQVKLRDMAYNGFLFEKIVPLFTINDVYNTYDVTYYYKGIWSSSVKKTDGKFAECITLTLCYGLTDSTKKMFSTVTNVFTEENDEVVTQKLQTVISTEIQKMKVFLDKITKIGIVNVPDTITGFYQADNTVYKYQLSYALDTQSYSDNVIYTVTYTLSYGTDNVSNIFSVNKKSYNLDNSQLIQDELVQFGQKEIKAFFDFLDLQSGVKLVIDDNQGIQEIGTTLRDPETNSLVISAYSSNQQLKSSTVTVRKLTDLFIPLAEHFDDNKFSVISRKPVQKEFHIYDGTTEFEPVWNYYNPDQLAISGDIRSKEVGTHYAVFTPKSGYVWYDGTSDSKTAIWTIKRRYINSFPEQAEMLIYNGDLQQINLKNYDERMMTLSGTVSATDANTVSNPYYIAYVTPKDGFWWSTNTNNAYEVRWKIKSRAVKEPSLKSTSSLDFTYDASEKSPEFCYDTDLVKATGTFFATEPNVNNNKEILLTRFYEITFSLSDKQNCYWCNNNDSDDIKIFWCIRRKSIPLFTVSNTSFVYDGQEKSPVITPNTWDPSEVSVLGNKGTNVQKYLLEFQLTHVSRYEWSDGSIDTKTYSWEIKN